MSHKTLTDMEKKLVAMERKVVMSTWHYILHHIIRALRSKYTELFIGGSMFTAACYEIYESIHAADSHLGSKHGVALMGILTAIRCTAELLHGAEMIEEAEEKKASANAVTADAPTTQPPSDEATQNAVSPSQEGAPVESASSPKHIPPIQRNLSSELKLETPPKDKT